MHRRQDAGGAHEAGARRIDAYFPQGARERARLRGQIVSTTQDAFRVIADHQSNQIEVRFSAVHESGCGTFRTWSDVRLESAIRGNAEVAFQGREDRS
jgi:hypothetical protein